MEDRQFIMPEITLISGTRQTGKTTLAKCLKSGGPLQWIVYGTAGSRQAAESLRMTIPENFRELAFATELKRTTYKFLLSNSEYDDHLSVEVRMSNKAIDDANLILTRATFCAIIVLALGLVVGAVTMTMFAYVLFLFRILPGPSQVYNALHKPPTDLDKDKDKMYFLHPYNPHKYQTLRQYLIDHGTVMREDDPSYWIKELKRHIDTTQDRHYIVSDWRFQNEAQEMISEYSKVHTLRVYRSDVKSTSEPTEHDLDDYKCDLLLVTSEEEFDKCLLVYPQYKGMLPL